MKDFYNVKVLETLTSIEIWEYLEKPVIYTTNKSVKDDKNLEKEIKEKTANESYDAIKRKQKHYEAMRWEIARLVDCNFDDKTKFMTLTFKKNIEDISYTNKEFNKFVKRLNYYLYKSKKQKLKYLAVWEKQKRGAIHYHIIFFDLPYIKKKELQDIWGFGFIKINKIDVDSKENRGRYVSKYFSKNIDIKEYKQKAFFKSQNLKEPKVSYYKNTNEIEILKDESNVVYTKEYTRKTPKFNTTNLQEDYISFGESVVRYTKIRKE